MDITSWNIYWITRLDGVRDFFAVIMFLLGAALLAGWVCGIIFTNDFDNKRHKDYIVTNEDSYQDRCANDYRLGLKLLKSSVVGTIIFVLMFLSFSLIPTTKEMVAVCVIPSIANNEIVKEVPENTASFINEQLKKWIKDVQAE